MSKDTAYKCQEILLKIVEMCNAKKLTKDNMDAPVVSFFPDFLGWSLTVCTPETHYHVGYPNDDGSFGGLVDQLHKVLVG